MSDLRSFSLFSHFSGAQLQRLIEHSPRRTLAEGTTVYQRGEDADTAFVIEEGSIRLQRATPFGPLQLAHLAEGNLVGEMALLKHLQRPSDAITTRETIVRVIERSILSAAFDSDARFAAATFWSIWMSLAHKLRITNRHLETFFLEDVIEAKPRKPLVLPKDPDNGDLSIGERRQLLAECGLSNLETNFIASLSQPRRYKPDGPIFFEGDAGDEMYFVAHGRVMVSKYIPGSGEEAFAFLERGDVFGEMSLIDDLPRSTDAKAGPEGTEILAVSREVLQQLINVEKASSVSLLRLLCRVLNKRLDEADEKLAGWYILSGGNASSSLRD